MVRETNHGGCVRGDVGCCIGHEHSVRHILESYANSPVPATPETSAP